MEEAAADQAYAQVGSVVSNKFLVYQQKLADVAGRPIPAIAPEVAEIHETVLLAAAGPLR